MENETKIQTIENRTEILPNIKQQNKLITYFATGENIFLHSGEVIIDDESRQSVLDRMGTGDIDRNQKIDALMCVASPMDLREPEAIFADLEQSSNINQIKGILACFDFQRSDYDITPFKVENFSRREHANSDSLISFFDKYQEPISFKYAEEEFIKLIAYKNGEKKADQYRDSMSQLKMAVFGNRQEYYNQIQLIQDEANQKQLGIEAQSRPLTEDEKRMRGYAQVLNNRATELPMIDSDESENIPRSEPKVRHTGMGVLGRIFKRT